MGPQSYDRLSALDNSFLLLERPNACMHVASLALYEAAPLASAEGGVDFERIRAALAGILHRIPRYRQKLAWVPLEGSPVWVDDASFNLDYHLRHTTLPRPGSEAQLKQLAARLMAQRLDRARPLWELWVIEGISGGRFAHLNKIHHCMIDGMAGVDIMHVMMSPDPAAQPELELPFVPRAVPTPKELLRDEISRRVSQVADLIRDAGRRGEAAGEMRGALRNRLRAAGDTISSALRPSSPTPINRPVGAHRRFDWLTLPLDELRRIRAALGGSLNDVVLAIVTGAVREFLTYRRVPLDGLDFRVMAPVSVRVESERGALGNHVSAWILPLPVAEEKPRERLLQIAQLTGERKASESAVGAQTLTRLAEWMPATLLSLGARQASRIQPFNLVVTNVPGPQVPLYLIGARMLEIHPMVPLMDNLGLGIALFSYAGRLHWGFNADYELVPDLEQFLSLIERAFAELRDLAAQATRPPPPDRRKRRPRRVAHGDVVA